MSHPCITNERETYFTLCTKEKGAGKGYKAEELHSGLGLKKKTRNGGDFFQQIPPRFIVLYDFAHRALVCPYWNYGLF